MAAIITASVAYRAGRKTPYETLKTLVEILEKLPTLGGPDAQVLETAIHREIQKIDRLNQARIEGWWALQRERLAQLADSDQWGIVLQALGAVASGAAATLAIAALQR